MTSAPRVNQMRFLSSSALAKADQLILAASCSAADAIALSKRRPRKSAECETNDVPAALIGAAGTPYHMVAGRAIANPGAVVTARPAQPRLAAS